MKSRLDKLLSVKSIVTIILTLVFSYLAIVGKVTGEQVIMIYTTVVAFYFGTQTEKKTDKDKEE